MASVWGPSGVTCLVVFEKRDQLFAYSFAGPFWRGSGACFGLQKVILGSVLGGVWVGLGPGKSCQSVQLYAFSGFGRLWSGVCFRIRLWKGAGMHLGRFECRLGHPLEASGPLFQRLEATFVACRFLVFFGRFPGPVKIHRRAKVDGNYVESGAQNSNTTDQLTNN